MTLESWALVAEIVGSVAVVLSLIFVGIQIRHSREETRKNSQAIQGQVRQAMLDSDLSIISNQYGKPYFLRQEGLTEDQKLDLTNHLFGYIRSREIYWQQYRNGLLDEDTFESYLLSFITYISDPDYPESTAIWESVSSINRLFSEDFIRYVNQRIVARKSDQTR